MKKRLVSHGAFFVPVENKQEPLIYRGAWFFKVKLSEASEVEDLLTAECEQLTQRQVSDA